MFDFKLHRPANFNFAKVVFVLIMVFYNLAMLSYKIMLTFLYHVRNLYKVTRNCGDIHALHSGIHIYTVKNTIKDCVINE
jgi:hypothetical protein